MSNVKTKVSNYIQLDKVRTMLETFRVSNSTIGVSIINGSKIETIFAVITPDLAQTLLDETNKLNRKVNPISVNLLTKEMENDKWNFNGDSIRFNKNGVLSDGQHRLLSIVKSGKSQICLIVLGIDEESFETIDIGLKRSASDIFSIYGIENPVITSQIVKFIYAFENNKFSANRNTVRNLNNQDIIPYYETLVNLRESVNFTIDVVKRGQSLVMPATVGGLHYLMSKIDKNTADDFIEKMCVGENLDVNSPILLLRNRLIKAKTNNKYKLTNQTMLENIVQTWNYVRSNTEVKALSIRPDFEMVLK